MDSFYEQSEEIGSAMFSYSSHTMGKQEERKKSDRKTGKERRKASTSLKKTQRLEIPVVLAENVESVNTIWCINRGGHWGTPILDDGGCLSMENFCVDCKHAEDKREKWLKSPEGIAWEAEEDMLDRLRYGSLEWEADMLDMMEYYWEQQALAEKRRLQFEAMERILMTIDMETAVIAATEDPLDDYIPEIDDNFDD